MWFLWKEVLVAMRRNFVTFGHEERRGERREQTVERREERGERMRGEYRS